MNRRSFFGLIPAVPAIAMTAPVIAAADGITRVSIEEGDPGYIPWCKLMGDGKTARVCLDGVDQNYCLTADAAEGFVKRYVETENGNLAVGINEVPTEIARGSVRIEIIDRVGYRNLARAGKDTLPR